MTYSETSLDKNQNLRVDCAKCFGLCCVALYFSASEGFPMNKEAGQPCINLQSDYRCCVYKDLRKLGLKGCTAFDCFGAGQKVSQVSFAGKDWRESPQNAKKMFEVFQIMRQLHELLWYLTEALTLQSAHLIHEALSSMLHKTERITYLSPASLMELDVAVHREDVNSLLQKTSDYVRAEVCDVLKISSRFTKTLGGRVDLIGADLKRINLRGANLRGAYLMAADLRGADLTNSIFLTQAQINTARGDNSTKLPSRHIRPTHWDK